MLGRRPGASSHHNAGVKKPLPYTRSPSPRPCIARRRACGFTLIEVMVALIILVLGVLGAAAMTLAAIRDSKQSGLRSQASAFAYELSDLMRANAGPGSEAVFTGAVPAFVATCWSAGCAPIDMARNDYYEWFTKLTGTNGLPGGGAVICRDVASLGSDAVSYGAACDGLVTSPLVVKLTWTEKNNNARGAVGPTAFTTAYLVVPIQPY